MNNNEIFNKLVENQIGGKSEKKWDTLKHNGIIFEQEYIKKDIPLIYDGNKIILPNESEKYALIYAKFLETDYVKIPKFNKNFFNDWIKILKTDGITNIKEFDKCDFKLMKEYLINKKLEPKLSEEDKIKENKKYEKYKTIIVDGEKQLISNFRLEPSSLYLTKCFQHPKIGKIKKTIIPEDIIINIGENEKIPELPNYLKNHKFKKIIHNHNSIWIAAYRDDLTGKTKYIWLSDKSKFKSKADYEKFELARKLKQNINNIRKENFNNLINTNDNYIKQLAVALYLIDKLLIRVGNEKKEDESETFGICTLQIRHLTLLNDNHIKLEFSGKDNIHYKNTVKIDEKIYETLISFIKNKNNKDDIFDLITPINLNNYIQEFMPDLTAKTFRTMRANEIFQEEIDKINDNYKNYSKDDIKDVLLDAYIKANIKVALSCNHQKKISKSFADQINKLSENIKISNEKKKITTNKDKIHKLNEKIKKLKNKRELKSQIKNLSITTSKVNYIDPRISIAFIKKHNLNIDKILTKNLQEKFNWAINVDKDWIF